ncbi:MAG: ImmA/IrrE family metallo-endopeptidase [Synergistaceae bacterium]|jgi:Zn-dependent peptidase ImmA (M78 family)|nr:ImmA/IrrE family metallo-endopeptidase [Synergistaceae bacterium]
MHESAAAKKLLAATLPLMRTPPVNLGVICDCLKVEVYAMPCEAFGAAFSHCGGRRCLLVNSRLPQGRFRFSIAHELGHFLLRHRPLAYIGEKRSPAIEKEADAFASELLLPEDFLRADAARFTVPDLARRYKVSRQALEIRMKNLKF